MAQSKLYTIILFALLGVSALLSVLFFAGAVSEGLLLTWCYVLLGLAAITAVVFPILTMAKNPAGAKSALIGVVALVAVLGISYALAGSEEYFTLDGKLLADEATSKKSGAGLTAFYITGALAIGAIVWAEVSKMLK